MTPYFYNKKFSGLPVKDVNRNHLNIGNDVWISSGVTLTCGCHKIGNGAVVGAGAVVTKDIPPYAIVGGVPAKIIRYRFDADTIQLLEDSKWFDLTPKELMEFYGFIDDPKEFSKK